MKLAINYNNKKYTLAYTRATAKAISKSAQDIKDNDDVVAGTEVMLKAALKTEQPNLPANEVNEVVNYIMNNCQLVDKEGENGIEKGMLTLLNEMLSECLPKGFTGNTAKGFVVVE